jgi:NO-binding membrane sensor protein with MHYT domain
LMAYVIMSALNLATGVIFLRPTREWDGLCISVVVASDAIACRLILILRQRINPTQTRQDRQYSVVLGEAIARLGVARNVIIDDAVTGRNQPIERWD